MTWNFDGDTLSKSIMVRVATLARFLKSNRYFEVDIEKARKSLNGIVDMQNLPALDI